jgi:hypothetical protein
VSGGDSGRGREWCKQWCKWQRVLVPMAVAVVVVNGK